jgi:PilZ domain
MDNPARISSFDDAEPNPPVNDEGDRRHHIRNVRVMRVARLKNVQAHAESLGMVRDVSPGGMMIDAHFPLEIGDAVSIALLDDQELSGVVAWKDGKTVGVSFTSEIPVEAILAKPSLKLDGKRARLPRFAARRAVQLKTDAAVIDASLHDVSQRGAKLQCEGKFRVHANVLMRMDGLRSVGATVKWRAGEMLGVEFHRLLPVDELASWLVAD